MLLAQLGLRAPEGRSLIPQTMALLALSLLLGLAAAQPVLATHSSLEGRNDAAAFFVFDVSRSMSARRPGSPNRLDQARREAKQLRAELPGLPVGVASITDRLLPHLFPSVSVNTFDATLDESLAIDRPTSSLPYGNALGTRLGALQDLVIGRYFEARAKRRVAVVFTDGETLPNDLSTLPQFLEEGGVKLLFFRFWHPNERVYDAQGRGTRRTSPIPTARRPSTRRQRLCPHRSSLPARCTRPPPRCVGSWATGLSRRASVSSIPSCSRRTSSRNCGRVERSFGRVSPSVNTTATRRLARASK